MITKIGNSIYKLAFTPKDLDKVMRIVVRPNLVRVPKSHSRYGKLPGARSAKKKRYYL